MYSLKRHFASLNTFYHSLFETKVIMYSLSQRHFASLTIHFAYLNILWKCDRRFCSQVLVQFKTMQIIRFL
jgi:hypothetical protein